MSKYKPTASQIKATSAFHLRVAAAYESVGRKEDAESARNAAARLTKKGE